MNGNKNNITTEAIIERLKSINKDVIGLETAYEYGGNCCTCPSADITELIRELKEEVIITPIDQNQCGSKTYTLDITPTNRWIASVHETYVDTVPGFCIRGLIKSFFREAHRKVDIFIGCQIHNLDETPFPGYYNPDETIRVKLELPKELVENLSRYKFKSRDAKIIFSECDDQTPTLNFGKAEKSRFTEKTNREIEDFDRQLEILNKTRQID